MLVSEEVPNRTFLCHILAKHFDWGIQIGIRESGDRLLQIGVGGL